MAIRKKIEKKTNVHWEREALEKIALSALGEQRIARRWGIFFKSITFFYMIYVKKNILEIINLFTFLMEEHI